MATCPLPLGIHQDTSVLFSPRFLQLCSGVMVWSPLYLGWCLGAGGVPVRSPLCSVLVTCRSG